MQVLVAFVFAFVSVAQVPNPRPRGWVSDGADQLSAVTEDTLNALAEQLYRTKMIELAVVVVAGAQAIRDRLGVVAGESTYVQERGAYRDTGEPASIARDDDSTAVVVGGGAAVAVGLGLVGWRRRRKRTCGACNRRMLATSDLGKLDAGQHKELELGTARYEVMTCPGCHDVRAIRHARWFTGFHRCPGCHYKTGHTTSTTLAEATYAHGGEVRDSELCAHCDYEHSTIRHTAVLTATISSSSGSDDSSSTAYSSSTDYSSYSSSSHSSSSDTSSSSSDFGGGSSDGGGAGSSW